MTQIMQVPEDSDPSTSHVFKWPLILAALSGLSLLGVIGGGIGPCGGAGIFFLPPFFLFGIATVVMFLVNCGRAISRHRNERDA